MVQPCSHVSLFQINGANHAFLHWQSWRKSLFDNLASTIYLGFDASAFHHEDGISGSHVAYVWYRSFAILLFFDHSYAPAACVFGSSPYRIAVGITARPVYVGLDAQMGQDIVGCQDVAVLYVWYEYGC